MVRAAAMEGAAALSVLLQTIAALSVWLSAAGIAAGRVYSQFQTKAGYYFWYCLPSSLSSILFPAFGILRLILFFHTFCSSMLRA
jgi:hypothetical protein